MFLRFTMAKNDAEQFVSDLCTRSFLSLWSYPNPQGKEAGKEHCDFLVVCHPDIIIFSAKDITFKDTGQPGVDHSRWRRRALKKSVEQVYEDTERDYYMRPDEAKEYGIVDEIVGQQ